MTSDTDIHDKLRAVFLAAIMVVSMAAVGATFAGSAAANTDDGATVWAGQDVVIDSGNTDVDLSSGEAELFSGEPDNDAEFIEELNFEDGGPLTIETDDLAAGPYYVTDGTNTHNFTVRVQSLDVEPAVGEVANGGELEIEVDSNRGSWDMNVSADGDLSGADLEGMFEDDFDVTDTDDEEATLSGVTDDDYTIDFDGIDAGEYTFDFNVVDSNAEDSFDVVHLEAVDAEIDFTQNTYSASNGDIAEITFTASGTDEVQLMIGQPADEFNATLEIGNLNEVDDDEEIVVQLNTFTLGNESDEDDIFNVENEDVDLTVDGFDVLVDGGPDNEMVAEDRFRLDLQPSDGVDFLPREAQRANFQLEERSTGDINSWTLTADLATDLNELEGDEQLEAIAEAIDDETLIQDSDIAEGDALVIEHEATGLSGMFANVTPEFGITGDDPIIPAADAGYISLEYEEQGTERNQQPVSFSHGDALNVTTVADAENGAYYTVLVLDDLEDVENERGSRDMTDVISAGNSYETTFSVIVDDDVSANNWALVGPNEDGEFEDETAQTEWAPVEASLTLDWDDVSEEQFERLADAGQEISGSTTVAPGSSVDFIADGTTVTSDTTTVEMDGDERVFTAEFDFSGAAADDLYDLEVFDDEPELERYDTEFDDAFLIVGDDVEEANFQVSSDDATATPGEELEIEVDVENTGDEEDTQNITFSVEGEEVDSQELTLEGGEEETLTFEYTAPEEEGDYEWTVASDDDEATYTLTVEDDVAEANFEIVDVTPGEDMTVEPGEALTIDAEIENTGDEEATQDVVFNFDGADLVDEELTLDGGESDSVTFNVDAPDDEGDYAWFVATDDDESATWTLTVEADEPADTDDTDDTDDVDETDDTDDTDDADDDGAGFGVIVAALALLGAALLAIRRQVQLE